MRTRRETQTRTFTYYSQANRLVTSTNPENGTVRYTYDAERRLQRKTDAKGQKVEYTYDSYDRVSEINRYPAPGTTVDPCQRTKLYCDYNGVVQYFAENTWGRLAVVEWGGTGCPGGTKLQEVYSYTPSGQVTKKRVRATRVAGLQERSADLDVAYTYDTAGRLATTRYPDTYADQGQAPPLLMAGVKLKQFYNDLGQLSRPAEDRGVFNSQPVYLDLITTAEYNAAGQMTRMVTGAATNGETETRTYNERLQLSQIDWTEQAWSTYSCQYEYATEPEGSDNNGQVRRAVMSYPQQVGQGWQTVTEQITYQYDWLRRLTSAGSTKPWSETYTYDGHRVIRCGDGQYRCAS